ncbi:serine/threonine-protein kinase [Fimbriimonas ginsengisoli]|uniref:non-specific serine/threonine protein kinase n=1 Tax=Fimbriimonas ginsengisoli Gsoil 348 TaxID=661478 RepID=A0A068NTM1_FIMGI|nr:serine/threonine-protein kinase [Fimbriimonas ginsengisoli]AIE86898.1 Putative calcium/calmodulin-dependent protein kinase [Fimbriimonas ginsengisoli Gsoil 348]
MSSPPTTLGQYQIIREIARSNDIVYEAYDPLMNRRVAVKELAMPTGMTDAQKADRISRFKREAQAAGTLNHTNIMTVYSFAEEAGRIFMAMEYLDGHTLRNEIDTKGFVPIDRAIQIALAVLEGLGHAHSKGVIHRDIKPDNIQILSNSEVKITDFGIARLTFQPNLTMDGQVFGTPSYMSPEQVVGRDIDARSDLFSLAVVLYEMISGSKPFPGDSVVSITYAIMNKEPQQPTQATWSLWQVLSRALDKSPQLRYASAADMIEALRDAERQAVSGTMGNQPAQTGSYAPYGTYTPAVAAPPPVPYSQPPSPYPTAYNPYQPQPPVHQTPYGYNTTGYPVQQSPYGLGHTMPPPGPLPIYYPPPPRPPLLKPETIVFLRKMAIAALILGALFALVFVGFFALVNSFQHTASLQKDRTIASQISSLDPHLTLEDRIDKANQLLSQLPVRSRPESARAVAAIYEQVGKRALAENDTASAEGYFKKGIDLDKSNPKLYSNLGKLYETIAFKDASDLTTQANLLVQSGDNWIHAQEMETDPQMRDQYGEAGAAALVSAAQRMQQAGSVSSVDLRDMLYRARDAAPPTSSARGVIQQMLTQLGGQ